MIVLLAGVPFVLGLCVIFTGFLDPFGSEARALIAAIARGEFSRIFDLLGYLALLIIVYGFSAAMIYGMVRNAVFTPDQHVRINPDTKEIQIEWRYLLSGVESKIYGFDGVDYIELKAGRDTHSDQKEVWLHVADRQKPIVLVNIFVSPDVFQEYKRLLELGFPRKPAS